MKRVHPLHLLLFLSLLLPAMTRADKAVDELMKQGSVFDVKLQPSEALTFYLAAEKLEPDNVLLLLCIARQYRHQMADAKDIKEKRRLGELGKAYAEKALALAPNESEAHLSVAISHAKMTPILGNSEKLEASRKVKSAVDKSLELNPGNDLAWHILGSWHQRLAELGTVKRAIARLVYGELPAASNEEAVKCFQEAIKLNPNRLIHHIELGITFARIGKKEEAKKCIEKGLGMPDAGKDDPEIKQRGREALSALE